MSGCFGIAVPSSSGTSVVRALIAFHALRKEPGVIGPPLAAGQTYREVLFCIAVLSSFSTQGVIGTVRYAASDFIFVLIVFELPRNTFVRHIVTWCAPQSISDHISARASSRRRPRPSISTTAEWILRPLVASRSRALCSSVSGTFLTVGAPCAFMVAGTGERIINPLSKAALKIARVVDSAFDWVR